MSKGCYLVMNSYFCFLLRHKRVKYVFFIAPSYSFGGTNSFSICQCSYTSSTCKISWSSSG